MSPLTEIKLTIDTDSIAWLTLNRPGKHNALTLRMMQELQSAATHINQDDTIRAVVLGAEGESFCAGADLGWMRQNLTRPRQQRIADSRTLARMLHSLDSLNKLLIGRVHGQAYGGGVGLMCVCDIVVVDQAARFALTETRLGLVPANIGPYVIRRTGTRHARRILLNGHRFNGLDAVNFGLADVAVPQTEIDQVVAQEIKSALACAPGAIATTKQFVREVDHRAESEVRETAARLLADIWESREAQAGIGCFFDKTVPPWKKIPDHRHADGPHE